MMDVVFTASGLLTVFGTGILTGLVVRLTRTREGG